MMKGLILGLGGYSMARAKGTRPRFRDRGILWLGL